MTKIMKANPACHASVSSVTYTVCLHMSLRRSICPSTPGINLTLGLLGLTNITQALEEFNNIRVLDQLPSGSPSNQISPSSNKKLSADLEVLIGLACFLASCFILFGLEWLTAR